MKPDSTTKIAITVNKQPDALTFLDFMEICDIKKDILATCQLCKPDWGFPIGPEMWITLNRRHKTVFQNLIFVWKSRDVDFPSEWEKVQELWEQMWERLCEDINGS